MPYVVLAYDKGFYAPYSNSWSAQWGDEGFGYDSQRTYRNLTLYLILDIVVNNDLETLEI